MTISRPLLRVLAVTVAAVVLAGCSASPSGGPSSPSATKTARPDLYFLDLGDSNVFGDPVDCLSCTTFPHLVVKKLASTSGKRIGLIDGSQHNGLTAHGLWSEIISDDWAGSPRGVAPGVGPREVIAQADIITITVAANDVPWGNEDADPCDVVYDAACVDKIATPYGKSISGILDEISTLRGSKPTAIRVTTYYNEVLAGPKYSPAWPAQSIAQGATGAKTLIEAMNAGACRAAAAHGAVCVDIYHAINGPDGTSPLPGSWFSQDGGDLLQAGQDFYAKQLEAAGWAPLTL